MQIRYGGKQGRDYSYLRRPTQTDNGDPEILTGPSFGRLYEYGSMEAERAGFIPVEDYPDNLVDPRDFKEVINYCNEQQIFPKYHLLNTGLHQNWNQDGFGFCWAYGCTASVICQRAVQGLDYVRLAPFSLGWLVGWRNRGYYVDAALQGARERGIASAEFVPEYNLRSSSFKIGWEEDALNYRPDEFWETRKQNDTGMLQHLITILRTGTAGDVAFNWWRHALMVVGLQWDESEYLNVVVELLNSHNDGIIELTGWRAIPDVCFGIRSVHLPA